MEVIAMNQDGEDVSTPSNASGLSDLLGNDFTPPMWEVIEPWLVRV